MLKDIVNKEIPMPVTLSPEASSILSKFLEKETSKRLGHGDDGILHIKKHPFFAELDWEKMERKEIEPPFKPSVNGPEDTRQIDKLFTNETAKETPVFDKVTATQKEKGHFDEFTYDRGNL